MAEAKLGIFSTYYITCVQYRQEFNFPLIHVLFEIISTFWSTLDHQKYGGGEIEPLVYVGDFNHNHVATLKMSQYLFHTLYLFLQ